MIKVCVVSSSVKLISGCFFQESFAIDFTDRSDAADTLEDDRGSNNNEDFAGKDLKKTLLQTIGRTNEQLQSEGDIEEING